MATKAEIFKAVTEEVASLCEGYGVPKKFVEKLNAVLETNLKPKSGGMSVNIDEVTKKDENGNITHIQCSVSGAWLPATKEYFYEDKASKGINGLKRISRKAEAIRKQHIKKLTATERAIMADVLDGTISPEEGKEKLEAAKAEKPDYSSVTE